MALTLGKLRMHAHLALGGLPSTASASSDVTATTEAETAAERVASIINEAGRHLFSRRWGFRQRVAVEVEYTADQEYAALPDDAGGIEAIRLPGNVGGGTVRLVSPDELAGMRLAQAQITAAFPMVATIARPVTDADDAYPDRRLELYPTPSDDGSIYLWYLSRWLPVEAADDDSKPIHVPHYAESVLIALVRAVALGYEDDGMEARCAAVEAGPSWRAAVATDLEEHPLGSELDPAAQPYDPFANGTLELPS